MDNYPSYSVAIRTLGTAGEKYQETLDSIQRQLLKPEKIMVYIPYGYDLPKETIGVEEYVRCEKGMVTQRSLPFDEISSDYILFLDDDLSFEPDFVRLLFDGLIAKDGDCICPDIYSVHNNSTLIKIRDFFGGTIPHFDKRWSFKIRLDGHYSYNSNPTDGVLLTQSGAGACILCKKNAYKAIHFEDERWLDQFHFGLGEDQLFVYKLYRYGYRVLTSYDSKIIHLNAGAGHDSNYLNNAIASGFCRYMIWYRTIYTYSKSVIWKVRCYTAMLMCIIICFPLNIAIVLKHQSVDYLIAITKGRRRAKQFTKSEMYSKVPSYYEYLPIKQ